MAVAAWAASTAYSLGDVRRSTTVQTTGLVFKCTVAGTSGSSEPIWPTDVGTTATDGGATWVSISSVYEDISVLAPNAIVELFELYLDSTLHGTSVSSPVRWHNGCNANVSGNIVFNSQTYVRLPIQAEGFEWSNQGSLPRPTLTVANVDLVMTGLLQDVNAVTTGIDLGLAEVRRIRTLKKFLDGESAADPHAQWPVEIWYIDRKSSENRMQVSFELNSKLDLPGQKIPRRHLIGNICQWGYRSSECSYTGSNYWNDQDQTVSTLAEDKCGKRLDSCKLRFGTNSALPFGSFPTAGRTQ